MKDANTRIKEMNHYMKNQSRVKKLEEEYAKIIDAILKSSKEAVLHPLLLYPERYNVRIYNGVPIFDCGPDKQGVPIVNEEIVKPGCKNVNKEMLDKLIKKLIVLTRAKQRTIDHIPDNKDNTEHIIWSDTYRELKLTYDSERRKLKPTQINSNNGIKVTIKRKSSSIYPLRLALLLAKTNATQDKHFDKLASMISKPKIINGSRSLNVIHGGDSEVEAFLNLMNLAYGDTVRFVAFNGDKDFYCNPIKFITAEYGGCRALVIISNGSLRKISVDKFGKFFKGRNIAFSSKEVPGNKFMYSNNFVVYVVTPFAAERDFFVSSYGKSCDVLDLPPRKTEVEPLINIETLNEGEEMSVEDERRWIHKYLIPYGYWISKSKKTEVMMTSIEHFVKTYCIYVEGCNIKVKELHKLYGEFMLRHYTGIPVETSNYFGRRMRELGYESIRPHKNKTDNSWYWKNLAYKEPQYECFVEDHYIANKLARIMEQEFIMKGGV